MRTVNLKKIKSLIKYILSFRSQFHRAYWKWCRDGGDEKLKYDFDLPSNPVIFDLGTYRGEWVEPILEKFPDAKIYGFEAIEQFAIQCQKKFADNKNIHIFPFGLGSENGTISIACDENKSGQFHSEGDKKDVQIRKFSGFIEEQNICSINLIKINIEGGEYDVLPHLIAMGIINDVDNILVQFHNFVPNADAQYETITSDLAVTHDRVWCYPFVWEYWRKK